MIINYQSHLLAPNVHPIVCSDGREEFVAQHSTAVVVVVILFGSYVLSHAVIERDKNHCPDFVVVVGEAIASYRLLHCRRGRRFSHRRLRCLFPPVQLIIPNRRT